MCIKLCRVLFSTRKKKKKGRERKKRKKGREKKAERQQTKQQSAGT